MSVGLGGYQNFAAIIVVQLLWFLLVALRSGTLPAVPRHLAIGAIAGLPLGAVFDVAIGKFGNVFHYAGLELSGPFVLLNAILSYGIAVATVLSIGGTKMPPYEGRRRRPAMIAASVMLAVAIWLPIESLTPITTMFLLGALVLVFSEALSIAAASRGYLYQLIFGSARPMVRIWVFSVSTGLVYEVANYLFPLWVWINRTPTPSGNFLLIVIFGYFVLFFPVFTVAALLRHHLGKNSRMENPT